MEFKDVKSQNIEAIAYDADKKVLAIRFKTSGRVYHYEGVSGDEHTKLMAAESIGSFFHQKIRSKYDGKWQNPPAHKK